MTGDRCRVLIVEDDEQIATVLEDALRDEGYDVSCMPNGQRGLDHLKRWTPDLIVLDLMMPTMDGRSFRAAQRELPGALSDVPVIVLSGARNARAQAEAMAAVAAITKPFDLDEVLATVDRVCRHDR